MAAGTMFQSLIVSSNTGLPEVEEEKNEKFQSLIVSSNTPRHEHDRPS